VENYFAEFTSADGLLRLPRTPDNKEWVPYALTGVQVGLLHMILHLACEQQQEIENLRAELAVLGEAQDVIDCSISHLDPDRE
jgi:hypothetical protein